MLAELKSTMHTKPRFQVSSAETLEDLGQRALRGQKERYGYKTRSIHYRGSGSAWLVPGPFALYSSCIASGLPGAWPHVQGRLEPLLLLDPNKDSGSR